MANEAPLPPDPLSVACPYCKAEPGQSCAGQRVGFLERCHYQRHKIAVAAKACDDCGKPTGWLSIVKRCRECQYRESRASNARALKRRRALGIDKHKDRARRITTDAIKHGKLRRPKRCQRCNRKPFPRAVIHAHHPDYAKPLEVVWLCVSCHADEHRGQPRRPNGFTQEVAS